MNRQDYTETLLDHIERPRHYGSLPGADVTATGANPGCGDTITVYLKAGPDSTAQAVQFEGEGCSISRGAASILMAMVQGKPFAEIEAMNYNDLVDRLGRDVVLTRVRCATLALDVLKEAIRKYHGRNGLDAETPAARSGA
ncbi:MAG: iron-sulfur cluster assembly scaffold protein [Chloroflexi bacterium]|nr:MAG: iron-sulfur cluster assembly scaffold protein [Chloroflexota bacterium]